MPTPEVPIHTQSLPNGNGCFNIGKPGEALKPPLDLFSRPVSPPSYPSIVPDLVPSPETQKASNSFHR